MKLKSILETLKETYLNKEVEIFVRENEDFDDSHCFSTENNKDKSYTQITVKIIDVFIYWDYEDTNFIIKFEYNDRIEELPLQWD